MKSCCLALVRPPPPRTLALGWPDRESVPLTVPSFPRAASCEAKGRGEEGRTWGRQARWMRLLEGFSAFMRAGWGGVVACAATQLTPVSEVLSFVLAVSAFAAMDRVHGRLRSSSLEVVLPPAILLLAEVSKLSHSEDIPVTAHRFPTHGKGNKPQSQIRHAQCQKLPCSSRAYLTYEWAQLLQLVLPPQPFCPGLRSS